MVARPAERRGTAAEEAAGRDMSGPFRDTALKILIATIDTLSHQPVRRAMIERLQSLARRRHFRISAMAIKHEFPSHLYASYRAEETGRVAARLAEAPFWWIGTAAHQREMIYDSTTRTLWDAAPNVDSSVSLADAKQQVSQLRLGGLDQWSLPSKEELFKFAENRQNPLRQGQNSRLMGQFGWLTAAGYINLDYGSGSPIDENSNGRILACTTLRNDLSPADFIEMALQRGWILARCDDLDSKDLLATLREPLDLQTLYNKIDWLALIINPPKTKCSTRP
jgi:hypothetical protein